MNGDNDNWNNETKQLVENKYLQPSSVDNGKLSRLAAKMPVTKENWVRVPRVPRSPGGAISLTLQ